MKIKNLFYVMACSAFLFAACSDDDAPKNDNNTENVPENVLNAFEDRYGKVEDVKWENVQSYYVARFNGSISRAENSQYTSSAWYTPEGKYCQSDEDIAYSALPVAVKEGYEAYAAKMGYTDWKMDEWEMVSRQGMGLIYVVEIEKGNEEREISFSEQGDMLKDVLDVDDDDNDDILPVNVPEELIQAVQRDFAGATILEVEKEDGLYEVDIQHENIHKEAAYSMKFVLVSTEYEVTYDQLMSILDENTKSELNKIFQLTGVDPKAPNAKTECEVTEFADGAKAVELEIEQGRKELEIEISRNGKIRYEIENDDDDDDDDDD